VSLRRLTGTAKGSPDPKRSSNSLLDFLFLPLCNGYGVRSVALRNVQTLKRQRVRANLLQEIPNHAGAAERHPIVILVQRATRGRFGRRMVLSMEGITSRPK
jgi:hypothetical protein